MIEAYELGTRIHEDEAAGLQVFEAQVPKNPKRFFVKQYTFTVPQEIDSLLKAAVEDAHEEHSLEATIALVAFTDRKDSSRCYLNLVYENLLGREVPWGCVRRSQRSTCSAGLSDYLLGDVVYSRRDLEVIVATSRRSGDQVIIKCLKKVYNLHNGNKILKEAIAQALVAHTHNCGLIGIACTSGKDNSYDISLVMEKLDHDFEKELQQRKEKQQPYPKEELVFFLYQVTSGLLHAKNRVIGTQGFAHRDIKLANIFRARGGCVKVGDFGSAWNQSGRDAVPTRIPSLLSITEFEEFADGGDGTPGYLSPEMREMLLGEGEKVDSYASDVFSLGVCMLELAKLDRTSAAAKYKDISELEQNLKLEIKSIPYTKWIKFILKFMLSTTPSQRPSVKLINHLIIGAFYMKIPIWPEEDLECLTNCQLGEAAFITDQMPQFTNSVTNDILRNGMKIAHAFIALLQLKLDTAERLAHDVLQNGVYFLYVGERAFSASCFALFAQVNFHRKQFGDALANALISLEFLKSDFYAKYAPARIETYALIAHIYSAMGDHQQAAEYANTCLDRLQTVNSRNARSALIANRVHGIARLNAGELSQAQQYLILSLRQVVQYFPRNFRLMIQAHTDLATVFVQAELVRESLHCIRRALAFMRKFCNEDYELYCDGLAMLRDVNDRAREFFLQTSEADPTALHTMLSNCDTMSKMYLRMARLVEAEMTLRNALEAQLPYEEGPDFADCYHSLSLIEKELGKFTDAEIFTRRALNIYQKCGEKYAKNMAKCKVDLAEISFSLGDIAASSNTLQECEFAEDLNFSGHWQKCGLELTLDVLLGKVDEAEKLAAGILQSLDQSSLFATAELCASLAFFYAAHYQLQKSEEYTQRGLAVLRRNAQNNCTLAAVLNCNLAILLLQLGKLQEAEGCARECIDVLRGLKREMHPGVANAYLSLALIFQEKKEREKAWEMAEKCLECKGQEQTELYPDVSIFLQFLPALPSAGPGILSNPPDFNSYELLQSKLFSEPNAWGVCNSAVVSFLLLQFGKAKEAAYLLYKSPYLQSSVFPANSVVTAALWHNYACCLLELQQYDYALKCAEASVSVNEEMKNGSGKAGSYYLFAVIHHLSGEHTEAAYFADKFVDAKTTHSSRVIETLAGINAAVDYS